MPNHMHGIVAITNAAVGAGSEPAPTMVPLEPVPTAVTTKRVALPKIIRPFKKFSARLISQMRGTSGALVWQRNYYEHIVRNEESLNSIREYIINNPLRWDTARKNPHRHEEDDSDDWLKSRTKE